MLQVFFGTISLTGCVTAHWMELLGSRVLVLVLLAILVVSSFSPSQEEDIFTCITLSSFQIMSRGNSGIVGQ